MSAARSPFRNNADTSVLKEVFELALKRRFSLYGVDEKNINSMLAAYLQAVFKSNDARLKDIVSSPTNIKIQKLVEQWIKRICENLSKIKNEEIKLFFETIIETKSKANANFPIRYCINKYAVEGRSAIHHHLADDEKVASLEIRKLAWAKIKKFTIAHCNRSEMVLRFAYHPVREFNFPKLMMAISALYLCFISSLSNLLDISTASRAEEVKARKKYIDKVIAVIFSLILVALYIYKCIADYKLSCFSTQDFDQALAAEYIARLELNKKTSLVDYVVNGDAKQEGAELAPATIPVVTVTKVWVKGAGLPKLRMFDVAPDHNTPLQTLAAANASLSLGK